MTSGETVRPLFSMRFSIDSRTVRSMSIFGITSQNEPAVARTVRMSGSHHVGRATSRPNVSDGFVNVPTIASTAPMPGAGGGTGAGAADAASVT
jgi:hypothetical protein